LIKIQIVKIEPSAQLPTQSNFGDAGFDLYSIEEVTLAPFERKAIRTGISIALPPSTVGLVHPRSGMALNHGIAVLNSPGTIDSGYRGEIKVILINLDPNISFSIKPKDRIAQLVIQDFKNAEFELVEELPASMRGSGGFGSTGA
jgi:dUTP pyrophosphatase